MARYNSRWRYVSFSHLHPFLPHTNHFPGDAPQEVYISSKLALLLSLSQTKAGAKYVLHANLLRVIETSGLFAADPELEIDASDAAALERHYGLLARVTRIVAAAVVRQGSHNVVAGRRFLTMARGLVVHVLKRSVGIGGGRGERQGELEDRIEELAEAFMVLITATGFLDVSTTRFMKVERLMLMIE